MNGLVCPGTHYINESRIIRKIYEKQTFVTIKQDRTQKQNENRHWIENMTRTVRGLGQKVKDVVPK